MGDATLIASHDHDQRSYRNWVPTSPSGKKTSWLRDRGMWIGSLRGWQGVEETWNFRDSQSTSCGFWHYEHLEAFLDGDSVSWIFVVWKEPGRMSRASLLSHWVKFLQHINPISLLVKVILEKHDNHILPRGSKAFWWSICLCSNNSDCIFHSNPWPYSRKYKLHLTLESVVWQRWPMGYINELDYSIILTYIYRMI